MNGELSRPHSSIAGPPTVHVNSSIFDTLTLT